MITSSLEKIGISEQYICWWLGREPSQKDYNKFLGFLFKQKGKLVKSSKNAIDFRIFYSDQCSIHIIIRRKYFGIAINIHFDIGIHSKVCYTEDTLRLISKMYVILNRLNYGKCFLLPR